MLPTDKPTGNLQQLRLLSEKLAKADSQRSEHAGQPTNGASNAESSAKSQSQTDQSGDPSNKSTGATKTPLASNAETVATADSRVENLELRLEKLAELVNNLVEVNKIAYLDLKQRLDELQPGSG